MCTFLEQGKDSSWGVRGRQPYLLRVCVGLECNVPVVVVSKLTAYHLGAVLILEQSLHLLGREVQSPCTVNTQVIQVYASAPQLPLSRDQG